MRKLGISVYPYHAPNKDIIDYISMASKYNVSRIFTCLLSVEESKDNIKKTFREVTDEAHKYNMDVFIDISPAVFKALDISYQDLSFFKELGADGIRLDEGFTGHEESMMTFNPQGLIIELNMSNATKYLDNILAYQPKDGGLVGCHNFYPHRFTGLGYEHFIYASELYKKRNIATSAFIGSQVANIGPWPVDEGLCTLEMHRELPVDVQAKHLWATDLIDTAIIANMFASEEELKLLSKVDPYKLSFKVNFNDETSDLERKIVLEEPHFNRGDVSEYVIRSTQSRVKYKGESFPPHDNYDIKRGDIIVESSLYATYAGELQVALKDKPNDGKSNVVARISEDELFLLDSIKPWQKFAFYTA